MKGACRWPLSASFPPTADNKNRPEAIAARSGGSTHYDLSQWPAGLAVGLRLEELPLLLEAGLAPSVGSPVPRKCGFGLVRSRLMEPVPLPHILGCHRRSVKECRLA